MMDKQTWLKFNLYRLDFWRILYSITGDLRHGLKFVLTAAQIEVVARQPENSQFKEGGITIPVNEKTY